MFSRKWAHEPLNFLKSSFLSFFFSFCLEPYFQGINWPLWLWRCCQLIDGTMVIGTHEA